MQILSKIKEFLLNDNRGDNWTEIKLGGSEWRAEFIKHNRTGIFIPRSKTNSLRIYQIRYLLRSKRGKFGSISEVYRENDTFSVLSIRVNNEEESMDLCYEIANSFRRSPFLGLARNHEFFFKELPQDLVDLIDGAIAGDGSLTLSKSTEKSAVFHYMVGEKQRGHLEEFAGVLSQHGFEGNILSYEPREKDLANATGICLVTWTLRAFLKHKKRWYTDLGKKKLPTDVRNTSTFWRWFYAGDGSLKRVSTFSSTIEIAAHDFSESDVDRLVAMLQDLKISAKKHFHKKSKSGKCDQWTIYITTQGSIRFLNMIGPPIRSIEYKWAYPERPSRVCPKCRKSFIPKTVRAVFCSRFCKERY